jgi:TolB-like protein/DNA-binding winged helix-turn-helix (wHTH) protein/predicted Zn-dependent protease
VSEVCYFENFELDPNAYRLSRNGDAVRIERIPLELLCLLVERRGEVVTRNEILERIWGNGVFIDSENAINTAVRKIRRALNDDPATPRFIVTIPAKGYRFVAPMLLPNGGSKKEEDSQLPLNGKSVDCGIPVPPVKTRASPRMHWVAGLLAVGSLVLIASAAATLHHLLRALPPASSSRSSAELPLPDQPSIAVLPFSNLSGDREQEYFSDGITDDLITALSRLPGLFVIARASTVTYKGQAPKLRDVGKDLGVKYVLEGSVRKADGQVRITVHLGDTTNAAELWAERYDRPLRDVFALQDEIVRRTVTTLNLQLALSRQGTMVPRTTENLEAYDDLLRGTAYLPSLTRDGNAKAQQMLEKAIALDPAYSLAYAFLSLNYSVGFSLSLNPDPDALERALSLARRAVALDDSLSVAHGALAFTYLTKEQYEQALAEAQRGIALDANDAFDYSVLGHIFVMRGSPTEAIAATEKAKLLNPRNASDYLWIEGWAYTFLGQWDKAIAALNAYSRHPDFPFAHAWMAAEYYSLGDQDAARAEAARAEQLNRLAPSPDGYAAVAYAFNAQGKLAQGLAAAEQGMRLYPNKRGPLWPRVRGLQFQWVSAYTSLGRWEESLSALKSYVALYPGDIYAHAYLTRDYSALGRLDEARAEAAEVERGLMLAANFASEAPRSYDTLEEVMNDTGRPIDALAAAEKSNRPDQVKLGYLYETGRAYTQLGRWQEAISSLKAYLVARRGEVWPHVDLAVDYIELGDDHAARAEVAEMRSLNP